MKIIPQNKIDSWTLPAASKGKKKSKKEWCVIASPGANSSLLSRRLLRPGICKIGKYATKKAANIAIMSLKKKKLWSNCKFEIKKL